MPQFNPPDWLIKEYLDKKSPAENASQGIQSALQTYVQAKALEQQKQTEGIGTYVKAFEAGGPDLATSIAQRIGLKNPPTLPGSTAPVSTPDNAPAQQPLPQDTPTAAEDSAQMSMPGEHPPVSPIIAHFQQTMSANQKPATSPSAVPGLGNPEQLVNMGNFGKNRLAVGESLGKYRQTMDDRATKAEENGPKSFDYAKAFAKSADSPTAADPFIKIAQSEGRQSLTKREMDDIKNSINASAQKGRGEYYGTQAELNKAKFQNQLLQEGNKALNPNVAGGTLRPQQERLNRIGRAETLLQQMQSQSGGGDTRQMRELATSLATVLTGGNVVAQQQVEELIPQTYKGNLNKFIEKLTNNPTGLDQQQFIHRFADTLARERQTVGGQIGSAQQAALPGLDILKRQNPKAYQAILDANMNSPQTSQTPTVSSQDQYNALPSGSEYLSSDGVLHRKK